jgi:hypothetical protein
MKYQGMGRVQLNEKFVRHDYPEQPKDVHMGW